MDPAKFKVSEDNEVLRAKMACALLRGQGQYIGKDTGEIRSIFGDYTGHYFIDMSPAYIVGGVDKEDKNTWQIVFLINNKTKITKIIVHKNCCD